MHIHLGTDDEATYHVYHTGLASAVPYLVAALKTLDAGEEEYDPDLPPRVPGRKAELIVRFSSDEPRQPMSESALVHRMQAALLSVNPCRGKAAARTLASRLVADVLKAARQHVKAHREELAKVRKAEKERRLASSNHAAGDSVRR